jgi:hypothetical protein
MKQQAINNLTRIWKALKRELGNTEQVQNEFLVICENEFKRRGIIYNESEVIQKIIVNSAPLKLSNNGK